MSYRVVLSEEVIQTLKKMDRPMAARIYSWIGKNPEGCSSEKSRQIIGRKSFWRMDCYSNRHNAYRFLAKIEDEIVTIYILEVSHRSNVYD